MPRVRRHVVSVVVAWLLVCGAAVVLAATPLAVTFGVDAAACTCAHAPGTDCPMHHGAKTKSVCQWRTASNPFLSALVVALGPIGLATPSAFHLDVPPAVSIRATFVDPPASLSTPPPFRPPRA